MLHRRSARQGNGRAGGGAHVRTWAAVVLAVVSFAGALAAGSSVAVHPAGATGNGLFSIEPVSTPSSLQKRAVFSPVLSAGVSQSDKVIVVNETKKPMKLNLYAADAHTTRSGGFAVESESAPRRHMGSWIHLPVSQVTVPALGGVEVPFTYDVPSGAAPGDYAGGIVAVQTTGTISKRGSVSVRTLQAVAASVFGRVQGPLHPRLSVSDITVSTGSTIASELGGPVDATVTYSVTNTGNENLTPGATVSLSPLFGGDTKSHVVLPQILPGSTVTFTRTFHDVYPFGHLTATVSVQALGASGSGTRGLIVVPWGLVVVVLIVVALVLLGWRRRRRRARGAGDGGGEPVDPRRAASGVSTG